MTSTAKNTDMVCVKVYYCTGPRGLVNTRSQAPCSFHLFQVNMKQVIYMFIELSILLLYVLLLLPILCRAASSAALSHTGGFRVGGGVHDSYTFQCRDWWDILLPLA